MRRAFATPLLVAASVFLLEGCASPRGIVPVGSDRFELVKHEVASYPGQFKFRTELVAEATRHCAKSGRALSIVEAVEIPARNIIVNYRWARIEFECVPLREQQRPRSVQPDRKVASISSVSGTPLHHRARHR